MLWLTDVNPTFNKGTLKKCWNLEWEVGGRRCRKSRAYLWKNPGYAPACVIQKWRKTLVFCTQGSVIAHRTSFELLSKILRNLCESGRIHWVPRQWMEVATFGWRFCARIVFNTLQQQSLIASLEMRSLLLVAVWCLQKDVNVFSTKGNVSRNSDLKNIPAAVTCT